jgi:hypothetical protein
MKAFSRLLKQAFLFSKYDSRIYKTLKTLGTFNITLIVAAIKKI